MPFKPKRPCSYPGCPELTNGRYCEKHKRLINRQYEKYERDPQTKYRYNGRWKKIRDRYIRAHPLCEECMRKGMLVPAQMVDHIVPINKGGAPLDLNNLQSLCNHCHAVKTARDK